MSAIQWEYGLVERPFCERMSSTHDRLTAAEQTDLSKLRQLKSGLMTDLLEGRVRVPDGAVAAA